MNSALFQIRVDVFKDASEGAYGYKNIQISNRVAAALGVEAPAYFDEGGRHALPFDNGELIRAARRQAVLSCWFTTHQGTESFGMWRIYGGDEFAVAIATTVKALRSVFEGNTLAMVGNVNYEPLPRDIDSIHTLFFHKRPEYKEEREIRSVHVLSEATTERSIAQALTPLQLDQLLAHLITAPGMRQTMFDTILATVQTKFRDLKLEFNPSRLRRSALDSELLS